MLDEPDAHQDEAGEDAPALVLLDLRAFGKTVVVIARRLSCLHAAGKVLLLS
ncbi:MAG TPA: hypothetical protein VEC01_19675 [Noviherbaspirillum sp.]|uniref:hypothetical protein n=1 Tax=Noviherbaspirillum sp. TaxID=1926288 RepID=UPI002D4EC161|nr:hypothetical protein [Noviherbaspirillum sp.]HYD97551.1 hypothetical protein [Noviherbaspirillum sp.]